MAEGLWYSFLRHAGYGCTVPLKEARQWKPSTFMSPTSCFAELQAKAEAEGRTVDALAAEALQTGLEERQWQDLPAYGCETGRASGQGESDVPRIVREWRREERER